jgi:hypothetical protein
MDLWTQREATLIESRIVTSKALTEVLVKASVAVPERRPGSSGREAAFSASGGAEILYISILNCRRDSVVRSGFLRCPGGQAIGFGAFELIPAPKSETRLPVVLSPEEVFIFIIPVATVRVPRPRQRRSNANFSIDSLLTGWPFLRAG